MFAKLHKYNDPSTRSPNRFCIEMRLGIKWMVVTIEMVDAGGRNSLEAISPRTIKICLPKCFA